MLLYTFHTSTKCKSAVGHNGWPCYQASTHLWVLIRGPSDLAWARTAAGNCWISLEVPWIRGCTMSYELLLYHFYASTKFQTALGHIGWPCYHLNSSLAAWKRSVSDILAWAKTAVSWWIYPSYVLVGVGGCTAPYKWFHLSSLSQPSVQQLWETMYGHSAISTLF